jgi:hypothetical protein
MTAPDPLAPVPTSALDRLRLLWRVWWSAAVAVVMLSRHRLPEVVARLAQRPAGPAKYPPQLLSRAVTRGLRIGRRRPRCLIRSLVLVQLLQAQGERPTLVIGLADKPHSPDAHAWIELDGADVGPWPGRGAHQPLARYPSGS